MKKSVTNQKKGITPTMIMKSEKEKNYIYKLSNGTYIEFESKEFPNRNTIQQKSNPNQITLFN